MPDPTPPTADQAARDLVAQVRAIVSGLTADQARGQMERQEMGAALHALAVMEGLPQRLGPLVAAHDALGAVLNAASPGVPPILSMTTEQPA